MESIWIHKKIVNSWKKYWIHEKIVNSKWIYEVEEKEGGNKKWIRENNSEFEDNSENYSEFVVYSLKR